MKLRAFHLASILPVIALAAACGGGGGGGGGSTIDQGSQAVSAQGDLVPGALSTSTGTIIPITIPAGATRLLLFLDATSNSFSGNSVSTTGSATTSSDPVLALIGTPSDPFDPNDAGYAFSLITSVLGQSELAIDLATSTAAGFAGNTIIATVFAETQTHPTSTNRFELFTFLDPAQPDGFDQAGQGNTTSSAVSIDGLFALDSQTGEQVARIDALTIHDPADLDFFAFTIATTTTMNIAFGNVGLSNTVGTAPDLRLEVFDAVGTLVRSDTSNGGTTGFFQGRSFNQMLPGGTYTIRIRDDDTDTPPNTSGYILRVAKP